VPESGNLGSFNCIDSTVESDASAWSINYQKGIQPAIDMFANSRVTQVAAINLRRMKTTVHAFETKQAACYSFCLPWKYGSKSPIFHRIQRFVCSYATSDAIMVSHSTPKHRLSREAARHRQVQRDTWA
jgi:hypothetical protein